MKNNKIRLRNFGIYLDNEQFFYNCQSDYNVTFFSNESKQKLFGYFRGNDKKIAKALKELGNEFDTLNYYFHTATDESGVEGNCLTCRLLFVLNANDFIKPGITLSPIGNYRLSKQIKVQTNNYFNVYNNEGIISALSDYNNNLLYYSDDDMMIVEVDARVFQHKYLKDDEWFKENGPEIVKRKVLEKLYKGLKLANNATLKFIFKQTGYWRELNAFCERNIFVNNLKRMQMEVPNYINDGNIEKVFKECDEMLGKGANIKFIDTSFMNLKK